MGFLIDIHELDFVPSRCYGLGGGYERVWYGYHFAFQAQRLLRKKEGCGAGLYCDAMVNEAAKDRCYESYAIGTKDPSVCGKISRFEFVDECYNYVATAMKDPSVCGKIFGQNARDLCYGGFAKETGDISLCEKVESGTGRDMCYWDIASVKKDSAVCGRIKEAITLSACYSHCCD